VLLSEPDKGIYDALNKGIGKAGGDVVGFMHSDDVFADGEVLARVAAAFADPAVQAVYGDLLYVRKEAPAKVVRHWRAGAFSPRRLAWGWMPPHPTLYVQSAAGDAGGAIGCAYVVASQLGLTKERFHMDHAYWGPSFDDNYHRQLLTRNEAELRAANCTVEHIKDEAELCRRTAVAIADGSVIGWFQGRMEWGPRALGNRSILCDPRRADMKDILNLKIKRRESFRPFAPSILREAVPEWFETDDDVPFMMQVYQIREEKRPLIPAVTHVDGSGRLQTVYRSTNPRYYRLIEAFRGLTGVPVVLNTSFNENEPVVCKPEEALDCFLRTNMDVLVLGSWFVRRVV